MKKVISTFVLIALLATTQALSFALSDIDGHWAEQVIEYLVERNAINGYTDGTFRPDANISVAEFSKVLVAALGYNEGNYNDGHWAAKYMARAVSLGLIKTYETEFEQLDDNITRGMIARMITRAMDIPLYDFLAYKHQVVDGDNIAQANYIAVMKAYSEGIMTGYPDGTFRDQAAATRAEASTMLARLLNPALRIKPQFIMPDDYSELVVLPSGVGFQEPNKEGYFDFYLTLNIYKDVKPQINDARKLLERWIDEETITKILDYATTKQEASYVIKKDFYYNGQGIHVESTRSNLIIEIKGFSKEN